MRSLFIVFSVFLLLLAIPASVNAQSKLTWAPPALNNPRIINVAGDPNNVTTIRLGDNEDARLLLPTNQIVETKGIMVIGGRRVEVIGGHLKGTHPASQNLRAVLRFVNTDESVFVEGLMIDANNQLGLDGLLVGGNRARPDACADIYVQNTHIKNMTSTVQDTYHADGFQYYGCTQNTRMDRVSIRSQYQGMFLTPQHKIHSIDLRRVDLAYTDPDTANGFILYIRNQPEGRRPLVHLKNVYAAPRVTNYPTPRREDWERFSVHPPKQWTYGAKRNGNRITFPDYPEIIGHVKLGPRNFPYARENRVGLDYTSPGYIGVTPAT